MPQYDWAKMISEEKDKLVAETVMGWKVEQFYYVKVDDPIFMVGRNVDNWSPSSDLSAAWEVAEKFSKFDLFLRDRHYVAVLYDEYGNMWDTRGETTMSEAICKSALRAKGVDV